ncbi:RICIN domain-containing protein [Streptomyces sp. NPDC006463]|uniref:RICIN domain-containing protein n=1 Tax=Streptomyces sp. NPDC006463 TaxID=3364746 RepID=UPI0036A7B0F8
MTGSGGGPTTPSTSGSAPAPTATDPAEAPNGLFRMANVSTNGCLAIPLGSTTASDGLVQAGCDMIAEQQWYLTRESSGPDGPVYSVRNRYSGLCLSVDSGKTADDARVTHFLCGDRAGLYRDQFWKLSYRGTSRAWQLINVNSGKCIASRAGGKDDEPMVQQDCRDGAWLMWTTV